MKFLVIGTVSVIVCVVLCLILGALLHGRDHYWESKPDIVIEQTRISDQARREHYLMPQKDSPSYKEWVGKYGDSAESWELFTLSFHTKYLHELTKKLSTLEKKVEYGCKLEDFNEPNQPVKAN